MFHKFMSAITADNSAFCCRSNHHRVITELHYYVDLISSPYFRFFSFLYKDFPIATLHIFKLAMVESSKDMAFLLLK